MIILLSLDLNIPKVKRLLTRLILEDGEDEVRSDFTFDSYVMGLRLLCILIDERGQAVSRQAKIEVATRSYELLTQNMA